MAADKPGSVHIPWYATVFRGDKFEEALLEIAPAAIRYGAKDFAVYRSRDDGYKFLQMSTFDSKLAWERYWNGPEFIRWRETYSSWYQIPVLYVWNDLVVAGESEVLDPDEFPTVAETT
jgi:hypothetical protein